MIKKRRLLVYLLAMTLSFSLISVNATSDFAENESYYKKLCSSSQAKDNKPLCQAFNNYLQDKINESNNNANKYKGEMAKYKNDLAKQVELANEYEAKINEFNSNIKNLESEIRTLEESIKEIEKEIEAREAEIAEKDRIIIERMRKTQSDMRFGYEIDFLFKAKSFATLIASASIVSDIMDFEAIQIEEINKLIEQQKVDQDVMVVQQDTIELNIKSIESSKSQVLVLKAEVDIAVANYQTLMAQMEAKIAESYADAAALRKQIQDNQKAVDEIVSSGSFVRPIAGGYVSARVWNYPPPWSAVHIGYDYASYIGDPIRAAANGVVIASRDGCATNGGYLGNTCNGGSGNYIALIVSVNGKIYGINYFHMQQGSPIAFGSTVSAGQTIGRLGNSGNSTGPHAHVEVTYLGTKSISSYLSTWNGSTNFGLSRGLNSRCSVRGNVAPCRVDPGEVFGRN